MSEGLSMLQTKTLSAPSPFGQSHRRDCVQSTSLSSSPNARAVTIIIITAGDFVIEGPRTAAARYTYPLTVETQNSSKNDKINTI